MASVACASRWSARRWPFACENSDALTSFFLCFGPILLVYYPLLIFGTDRAKAGAINPYCVWLANVALVAWGLWLLRRVIRY